MRSRTVTHMAKLEQQCGNNVVFCAGPALPDGSAGRCLQGRIDGQRAYDLAISACRTVGAPDPLGFVRTAARVLDGQSDLRTARLRRSRQSGRADATASAGVAAHAPAVDQGASLAEGILVDVRLVRGVAISMSRGRNDVGPDRRSGAPAGSAGQGAPTVGCSPLQHAR